MAFSDSFGAAHGTNTLRRYGFAHDIPPSGHCRQIGRGRKLVIKWAAGYFGGSPAQLVEQLQAFVDAGVSRFMLQHLALDDLDTLELLAAEVLPHMS